jgi:CubicO group peptidase (beta-lactamase class C family)
LTEVVHPSYEQVAKVFASFRDSDPTYSAQLCVYRGAEVVLDLTCGGLADRGLLLVFSSSKASIAVVIGRLMECGEVDLDATVATYWPEFGAAGKERITVRQLLSHQAGLVGVDGGYTVEEFLAHDPLAERLAAQRPSWLPGAAHGYHGLTIGVLADELVRRITGRTLAVQFTELMQERAIDMHLGLPESLEGRVHDVLPPRLEDLAGAVLAGPPAGLALDESVGLRDTLVGLVNAPVWRRVGPPAAGGMATAAGLARLYACMRHDLGGPRLLQDDTLRQLRQLQCQGLDLTLGEDTRFGIAFCLPTARMPFGSGHAYGHDGAGGSMGFDDPVRDISLGYVVQRMAVPGGCDRRVLELADAIAEAQSSG